MLDVESRIRRVGHIKGIVTQSGAGAQMGGDQQTAPDLIGGIFVEMTDRRVRPEIDGFEVENRYREAIPTCRASERKWLPLRTAHPLAKKFKLNCQAMISICCLLKPLESGLLWK